LLRREWIEAAAAATALAFFRFYDAPAEPAFRACGFHWLTSLECPLCGLTRGLCAAAKGQGSLALQFHAFSPLVLAAILLWPASRLAGLAVPRFPWLTAALVMALFGALRLALRTL